MILTYILLWENIHTGDEIVSTINAHKQLVGFVQQLKWFNGVNSLLLGTTKTMSTFSVSINDIHKLCESPVILFYVASYRDRS